MAVERFGAADASCAAESVGTWAEQVLALAELGRGADARGLAARIESSAEADVRARAAARDAVARLDARDHTKAVARDGDVQRWLVRARGALVRGDFAEAAASFEQAAVIDPPRPAALALASLAARHGDDDVRAHILADRALAAAEAASGELLRVRFRRAWSSAHGIRWISDDELWLDDGDGVALLDADTGRTLLELVGRGVSSSASVDTSISALWPGSEGGPSIGDWTRDGLEIRLEGAPPVTLPHPLEEVRLGPHPSDVYAGAVAVSVDGRHVATGGVGGDVRIWDLPGGELVEHFVLPGSGPGVPEGPPDPRGYVQALAFSTQGDLVAAGNAERVVVRRWQRREELARLELTPDPESHHTPSLVGLAFDSAGERLLVSTRAYLAQWDLATGASVGRPMASPRRSDSVRFSPGGHFVLVGSGLETTSFPATLDGPPLPATAADAALSLSDARWARHDGEGLAVGRPGDAEPSRLHGLGAAPPAAGVAFSSTGALLTSWGSGADSAAWVWHTRAGTGAAGAEVRDAALGGDVLATVDGEGRISVIDAVSGETRASFTSPSVRRVELSSDGRILAEDGEAGLCFHASATGARLACADIERSRWASVVSLSPDGALALVQASALVLVSTADGVVQSELQGPTQHVAWAAGGSHFAWTAGDGSAVYVGSVADWKVTKLSGTVAASALFLSGDGTTLVVGHLGGARRWNLTTGEARDLDLGTGFSLLGMSREGVLAVAREGEQTIELWPVGDDGSPRRVAAADFARLYGPLSERVAFSTDGRWLALATNDGVRLVSAHDGREEARLALAPRLDALLVSYDDGRHAEIGAREPGVGAGGELVCQVGAYAFSFDFCRDLVLTPGAWTRRFATTGE